MVRLVKGLKTDKSETTNFIEKSNSEEPNHVKAKWTKRQLKTMPRRESDRSGALKS